jgi:hypothetical protein
VLGADLCLARVADNHFVRAEIGLLAAHRVSEYLTLVSRYRFRATDEFAGPSERENRFSFEGTYVQIRLPLRDR